MPVDGIPVCTRYAVPGAVPVEPGVPGGGGGGGGGGGVLPAPSAFARLLNSRKAPIFFEPP